MSPCPPLLWLRPWRNACTTWTEQTKMHARRHKTELYRTKLADAPPHTCVFAFVNKHADTTLLDVCYFCWIFRASFRRRTRCTLQLSLAVDTVTSLSRVCVCALCRMKSIINTWTATTSVCVLLSIGTSLFHFIHVSRNRQCMLYIEFAIWITLFAKKNPVATTKKRKKTNNITSLSALDNSCQLHSH